MTESEITDVQEVSSRATPKVRRKDESMSDVSRLLSIISGVALVATLIALIFFLNSDLPERIIQTKRAKAVNTVLDTRVDDSNHALNSTADFQIDIVPNDDGGRALVVRKLAEMDEQSFQALIDAIVDTAGLNVRSSDEQRVAQLTDALSTGDVSPAEVASLVESMSDDAFDELLTLIAETNRGDRTSRLKLTLADAYAEAERLYPGQIDGSKRLSRINELNEVDFKYYVAEYGDTLLALSQAFDVPLGQLVELNGIHDADVIPAGMIILFPQEVGTHN